jgi:hypothetical protein
MLADFRIPTHINERIGDMAGTDNPRNIGRGHSVRDHPAT